MKKCTNLMRLMVVVGLSLIMVVGYAQQSRDPRSPKASTQQTQVYQPSVAASSGQAMTMQNAEEKTGKQQFSGPKSSIWNKGISFEKPISNEPYDPSKYPVPDQGGETVATALVVNPASLPYTDAGTTLGYVNDYDEACPYTGSTSPDVCYSYSPAVDEALDIDLCASSYDTKVFVYENAVTAGSPYACNDDYYFGAPCYAYSSAIFDMPAYAGNTYYIIIDGYGGAAGAYSMTLTSGPLVPPPYNDECTGAVVQALTYGVPATFTGNNLGATQSTTIFTMPETWEAFTLPGTSNVVLDYCTSGGGTPWGNAWLNLATDCPVTSITAGGSYEFTTCGDGNVTITWLGLPAGTYYYPVMLDPSNNSVGAYTIHVVATAASGATGCENTSMYPSGAITVDPNGLVTTISTCSYAEEYSQVTGITAGETYEFTLSDIGTGAYITITDAGGTAGNILAFGPSPLTYIAAASADLFAHWTLNEYCATDTECHTTTVQCTSCVVPCNIDCPIGGIAENEPDILDEGLDVTNGGCNSTPNVFIPIFDGQTICGNFNTYMFGGSQYRDTDWYELDLSGATGNTSITWTVTAEFPALAFIIGGPCPGTILTSATANPCVPAVCNYVAAPGVYWLWAGSSVFTGYPAGGDWDYTGTVILASGPVAPPNDDCVNAEPVTGPYPVLGVTGTTIGATIDCAGFLGEPGVWYAIDLPYAMNDIVIDLCAATLDNGWIVGFPDCSCSGAYFAGSWNFSPPCVYDLTWLGVPGPGIFYYNVWTGTTQQDFTFDVDVTGGIPLASITPPSFEKQVPPGGSTTDILNVNNIGTYSLNYSANVVYPAKASVTIYPINANYNTGTCDATTFTESSLMNGYSTETGFAKFDLSSIPAGSTITSIDFSGYVNATSWPYWSITSLPYDPLVAAPSDINTWISANYGSGIAYSYNQEGSGFTTGWLTRALGTTAVSDMQTALGTTGYFSIGIVDFDFSTSYYINFDGWNEVNKPYIVVNYSSVPLWLSIDGLQSVSGSIPVSGSNAHTIGFDGTSLAVGTYTADIVIATNEPGTHIVPVTLYVGYDISGFVYYGDLNNLKPQATLTTVTATPGPVTTASGTGGAYMLRPLAGSTVYNVIGNSTKAWLGLNAPDPSFTQQYILGTRVLTNLQKRAADVNLSGSIQSLDVTMLKRRILSQTYTSWVKPTEMVWDGPFVPGWHGVSPTWIQTGLSVPVGSSNIIQNVRCLFSGDVNESGTPVPNP